MRIVGAEVWDPDSNYVTRLEFGLMSSPSLSGPASGTVDG